MRFHSLWKAPGKALNAPLLIFGVFFFNAYSPPIFLYWFSTSQWVYIWRSDSNLRTVNPVMISFTPFIAGKSARFCLSPLEKLGFFSYTIMASRGAWGACPHNMRLLLALFYTTFSPRVWPHSITANDIFYLGFSLTLYKNLFIRYTVSRQSESLRTLGIPGVEYQPSNPFTLLFICRIFWIANSCFSSLIISLFAANTQFRPAFYPFGSCFPWETRGFWGIPWAHAR